MVVIIGAGTTVTSNIISAGFVSVSFSLSPSVERLFQLGSFDAFDTQIQTQESISLSSYGGASTPVALAPSTSCTDSSATMDVTITPAPCTGSTTPINRTGADALFITSFSYSKDFQGFGQESWSLQGKPIIPGFTGNVSFIQGFSEGQHLIGADIVSNDGIVLTGSVAATSFDAQGRSISVSAGSASFGQDDTQEFGKITQIGGAVGQEDGKRGNSSANVPHTLVFF
jgi:hypothetical protein